MFGRPIRLASLAAFLVAAAGLAPSQALAQADVAPAAGSTTPQDQDAAADEEGSISTSIPALARVKRAFKAKGINLQINYTGEVLGNPTGGIRQGAIYEGLLDFGFDADLQKIFGVNDTVFHINAFQIHGRGLTANNIDNLATISGIEAKAASRLFEAFFERKLMDGKLSIKAGKLAEESDFFISDLAAIYVNGTYGWPAIWAQNLPSGGASYPFATPGLRIKYDPTPQATLLAGVYDGDPTGAGFSVDPQELDPDGVRFRLSDPPILLAEAQYRYAQDKDSKGLAGQVRLGGWYHSGRFGQGLSDGNAPADYRGDIGLYGIIDQMIYRRPGDDPKKGIGVFARLAGSPSDRNLIDFYVDAGINFAGLAAGRPDDVAGFAISYSHISSIATALQRAAAIDSGVTAPLRTGEIDFELTYQAQVVPGLIVQPDVQYIIRPGGGLANPLDDGRLVRDAAVFGVRTTIKF